MKKYGFLFLFIIGFSLLIGSCSKKVEGIEGKKAELSKLKTQLAETQKKIVQLEKEIKAAGGNGNGGNHVPVVIKTLEPEIFKRFIEVQGIVESQKAVMLSTRMGGTVVAINVFPGQSVSKGKVLIELDNIGLMKAKDELENQLNFAITMYEKQKRLYDKKAIPEVQYLAAKNQKEALEKRMESLNEQISHSKVVAPFSGVIDQINPKVGESVGDHVPVIKLTSLSDVRVSANVSETYSPTFKQGAPVVLDFKDVNENIEAKVTMAAKSIDPMTRAFRIQIKMPRVPYYVKPNMLCNVLINDLTLDNALIVLLSIIQKDGDNNFLFVAADENGKLVAKKRFVKLGLSYKDKVQITEGLSVGDKVIVEGAFDVSDGQTISINN